jgi:hypothetical protein
MGAEPASLSMRVTRTTGALSGIGKSAAVSICRMSLSNAVRPGFSFGPFPHSKAALV